MKKIIFEDIKQEIRDAIESKFDHLNISEKDGITLVNGFINQPIKEELSGDFIVGGQTIPMIAIVGNNTGRIYFFALKALLKDVEI